MSLRVYYEVLNQRGTPALFTDTLANRPAFGFQGRLFISTDSGQIFEDTGTAWTLVADAGVGGGTLSSVCLNGNTTATGIVITANGLTANAIIKSGGTASEFLKANGSVDSNTYLTTSAASSTYLPLAGGTLTGGLIGTTGTFSGIVTTPQVKASTSAGLSINANSGTQVADFGAGGSANITFFGGLTGTTASFSTTIDQVLKLNTSSSYTRIAFFNQNVERARVYYNAIDSQMTVGSYVTGGSLKFETDSNVPAMFIVSNGNIGIPTSNPEAVANFKTLQIDGTNGALFRTGTSVYGGYVATIGTADVMVLSNVRNPINGTYSNTGKAASVISLYGEANNGYITFSTINTNNTNPSVQATITSGGNLLIGTTTDNGNKLQVNGNIYIKNGNYLRLQPSDGSGFEMYIKNGGSGVNPTISFGLIPSTQVSYIDGISGVYFVTSDYNKKKDFESSTIGLNAILNLKPTLYRYKNGEENAEKHLGLIAQEVKEFIPQSFVEKDDFIGLDYNPIVATLIKAIQELNDKLVRNNIN